MSYRIDASRSRVRKQLKRIPKSDVLRIANAVQSLAMTPCPPGAVQLEKDVYRIRVGNYRVIYKIFHDEKIILIGRVARRSEKTYRDFKELFG